MTRWEYQVLRLPVVAAADADDATTVAVLDRAGAAGWEAVGISPLDDADVAVLLKRQVGLDLEARRGRPSRAPTGDAAR